MPGAIRLTFRWRTLSCAAAIIASAGTALGQAHALHTAQGPFAAPAIAPTPQDLAARYKEMAPVSAYVTGDDAQEIATARSAAPPKISNDAEILAFDSNGYHRAIAGKNGWTCLVQRSWTDDFSNPEFWNPRIRVPICFNPPASRSVLPVYLQRTEWVLEQRSLTAVVDVSKTRPIPDPEQGSLAIMMSKQGYVADGVGTPGPHVMVFLAGVPAATWGAGLDGVPIGSSPGDKPSITIFYLGVRTWSDGTPR